MKFRHELKFYINYHQYYIIRHRLRYLLKHDKYANNKGEYHIRSVYFDDVREKALHDKQAGIYSRYKYRIRMYNKSDSVIHFEKKIKQNNFIAKEKAPISRNELDKILANNYTFLKDSSSRLLQEIYYEMKNYLLKPTVIIDYTREAFVSKNGNVRITFDKHLRTGLNKVNPFGSNTLTIKALDEPIYILEVKYDEYIPSYILDAIQINGIRQQAISKYTICRKLIKFNSWEDQ